MNDFNTFLENELAKDEELRKEYDSLRAKEIKTVCPKCGTQIIYKNYWDWIWHTPFHWFGRRRAKCFYCDEYSYMKKLR